MAITNRIENLSYRIVLPGPTVTEKRVCYRIVLPGKTKLTQWLERHAKLISPCSIKTNYDFSRSQVI